MDAEYTIVDNGERETLENGGVREPDTGKPDYTYLPFEALEHLALFLEKAAQGKYARDNWKLLNTEGHKHRFLRSALRHLGAVVMGDKTEDHLTACISNLLFLLWHRIKDNK